MTVTTTPRKPTRRASTEQPRFYSYADIATITQLSLTQISELSLRGEIPGRCEFGRAVRHERAAVDRWLLSKVRGNDCTT